MYTITVLLLTLLTILSLTNATAIPSITPAGNSTSIRMILNNNCPFDVYVRQGIAAEPGSRKGQGEDCGDWSGKDTPEVKIGKGNKYVTPVPVIKNTCGHSVKVARKPAEWQTCYQYEFNWAQENGKIWYNLSSLNGNPFTDVARQVGGPYGSTCPYLRCQPGNDGRQCDWPLIKNCPTVGDIIGYLC